MQVTGKLIYFYIEKGVLMEGGHGRIGRPEDWNKGKLEYWKIGKLEDWNNGILEDWKK